MLALTHIRDRIAQIVFHHPSQHAFDSMISKSLRAGRNPDVNGVVVRTEDRVFAAARQHTGRRNLSPWHCRGFKLDMYMHEDSQQPRDAFVEEGRAAKF